ncbi:hypothetical protein [Nocardia heshunensis]
MTAAKDAAPVDKPATGRATRAPVSPQPPSATAASQHCRPAWTANRASVARASEADLGVCEKGAVMTPPGCGFGIVADLAATGGKGWR